MKINMILVVDLINEPKVYISGDINNKYISSKTLMESVFSERLNITVMCRYFSEVASLKKECFIRMGKKVTCHFIFLSNL